MPDLLFPNREALPEELRSFAKDAPDGNGVVVNLVANDKLKEFRDNNVKIAQERDALKDVVTKVTSIFPEFDPDKVLAEVTELRTTAQRVKDGQLTDSKAIEDAIQERLGKVKESYESQLSQRGGELKAIQGRNSILETRLKQQSIKQAILGVAADEKIGVHPSALDDIVNRAYSVFSVENDGEKLVPKAGDTIIYGSDGTSPMSVSEWVEGLKSKSPHLFKQSTGGGGAGGGNGGRFGGFSEQDMAKMSPEEKLRLANEQTKPRGFA